MKHNVLGVVARAATLMLAVACAGGSAPPATAATTPGSTAPANGVAAPVAPTDLAGARVPPGHVPVPPADAPRRGPENAPVTIQIWSDFECPYCALAAPLVPELEAEFGGSIRFVWRNLPLQMHPHAELAAETGLEIYAQRGGAAFWHYNDAIFAAQRGGLDESVIARLAKDAGVDMARYQAALTSHVHTPKIEADLTAADAAGINGTPAFFVNDWFAVGALPYPDMRAIVAQALQEAQHK